MNEISLELLTKEIVRFEQFALTFLDDAKNHSIDFWNNPTDAETKNDSSPVTALDKMLEEIVRDRASTLFPTFGVIGEEYGNSNLKSEFQIVVDPIDGTMSLVNRVPTFGVLISLMYQNKPIWGAIEHPLLGIRYYGSKLTGVFNEKAEKSPLFQRDERELNQVMIGAAAPGTFARSDKIELLQKLVGKLPQIRIYYDCFAHSMLVRGGLASNIDGGLRIWDVASVMALVDGRGGEIFEDKPWTGDPKDKLNVILGAPGITKKLKDLSLELR
jgi:fructose-1,6-bisphosphatase/inositol monophosphatase family enzyme